ncbi:ABC transporter substrate-binding protein [Streptomyces sp. NPDC050560]|uniref:ABC transporter substrate-binding protein n=1 Tax=Streptomyces sp. NPDC050560 TaxID=3365630 RepID=UPI00379C897A
MAAPRPRPPRRTRRAALAAAALLLAGAATACGSSAADTGGGSSGSATLRVGVIGTKAELTGPTGYLHTEKKLLPLLRKAGFTAVKVYPFPNGPDLNQALVGGSLDVASYGDTPALVARGSGLATRLISLASVDNDASVVVRAGGPTSLKDLRGKKIAVATGSYMHRYLLGALQDEHVEPAEITHVYTADTQAPLERGDIAAAALPEVNARVFESKGFKVIDHLAEDHPDYAGTSATVSTDDFLSAHPGFVKLWRDAQDRGSRDALADFRRYQDFETTLDGFPAPLVRETTLKSQLPTSAVPKRGLQLLEGTKKFLVEQKFIKEDFDLGDWIADASG